MTTCHKGTVNRGRVVISDVDLPDGTVVDVDIVRTADLTDEDLALIKQSEAAFERGDYLSGAAAVEAVKRAFRRASERARTTDDRRSGDTR